MADKKKSTSLNAPKVERGVKDALTPGEKPEKKQTPIEQVIGRELSEIVKDINFDAKFESIVTAIDSKETENLLPILEKISNEYNIPIIYFSFDSSDSDVAIDSRLEAFYDMLLQKKEYNTKDK